MTADTSTHTRTQPDNDHVTPTVIRKPATNVLRGRYNVPVAVVGSVGELIEVTA